MEQDAPLFPARADGVWPEAIGGTAALGFVELMIWTSVCSFFVADIPTVTLRGVWLAGNGGGTVAVGGTGR